MRAVLLELMGGVRGGWSWKLAMIVMVLGVVERERVKDEKEMK